MSATSTQNTQGAAVQQGVQKSTPDVVELRRLGKIFRAQAVETYALRDIDLRISTGNFVVIVGPSGCGKSTLMSILGLLEEQTAGAYFLEGVSTLTLSLANRAKLRNQAIGFVFQNFNLIGSRTVYQNVELPLLYRRMAGPARRNRVREVLDLVGLLSRADHFPNQLSGGQMQRTAIARAVVGQPKLLLADEPTGNLDTASGQSIMQLLAELHGQGTTICLVTHDPHFAEYGERIVRMQDGRILSTSHRTDGGKGQ